MRPVSALIILFILQAITAITTWYAITFLHGVEVNPIASFIITALPVPLSYIVGYIIAVVAYISGYVAIRYTDKRFNTNVTRYYFLALIIFKLVDAANDLTAVILYYNWR